MMRGPQPGGRAERALRLLKEQGPMTSLELSAELNYLIRSVSTILAPHHGTHWHIGEWRRTEEDGHLYPKPVYKFGPGVDAQKPPPLTKIEYLRRHRVRKKGYVNSVFALAVPVEKRRVTTEGARS